MNDEERRVLDAKIAELMHWALVTIRTHAWAGDSGADGRWEEIADITDLLHNLPRYIVGHDEHAIDSLDQLRELIVRHVRRFYADIDPTQHQYVKLLDMEPDEFLCRYRDHNWSELNSIGSTI